MADPVMTTPPKTPVLLLRAPSTDGGPDKYEDALSAAGYAPASLPVLETVLTNTAELAVALRARTFDGVVVTSARSCEAWKAALASLSESAPLPSAPPHPDLTLPDAAWASTPFYAVGEATAAALAALHLAFPSSPYAPSPALVRGGAEAGTGEALARFILRDVRHGARLLYLTGDKNRDVLPNILGEGGCALEALQVYATQGSARFAGDLRGAVERLSVHAYTGKWWIVFFAPSVAAFVTPILREHFALPSLDSESEAGEEGLRRAGLASIGPTTTAFLQDTLGVRVEATPARPTPDGLCKVLAERDAE